MATGRERLWPTSPCRDAGAQLAEEGKTHVAPLFMSARKAEVSLTKADVVHECGEGPILEAQESGELTVRGLIVLQDVGLRALLLAIGGMMLGL